MKNVMERTRRFFEWELKQHVNKKRKMSDRKVIELLALYRDIQGVFFDRNGHKR